jgi:hypothetical protein
MAMTAAMMAIDGENDNKRGDSSGDDNSHLHDTDGPPKINAERSIAGRASKMVEAACRVNPNKNTLRQSIGALAILSNH